MFFIFLSCREKVLNNKEFSRENSKNLVVNHKSQLAKSNLHQSRGNTVWLLLLLGIGLNILHCRLLDSFSEDVLRQRGLDKYFW